MMPLCTLQVLRVLCSGSAAANGCELNQQLVTHVLK